MDNLVDLPMGFCMSLAQNEQSLNKFSEMTDTEKAAVIERARRAASKAEMNAIVASITDSF